MKHIKEDFDMDEFTPEEQEIINSSDDMPEGFFEVEDAYDEDDIWDDDTYIDDDIDIHKTDIADSPDDEEFDYQFNDDDVIDVEDPEYWKDAKEINPNDYDLLNNPEASKNWGDTGNEDANDDTFTPEEHFDAYHNAVKKAIDPAHSEEFKRIMSLEDMPESKEEVKKNKLKEDTAFFCSAKPKDENRDLPDWVYERFGKIMESCGK